MIDNPADAGTASATETILRRHPSAAMLNALMAGRLPQDETHLVLLHLLRGCPSCGQLALAVWNLVPVSKRGGGRAAAPFAPVTSQAPLASAASPDPPNLDTEYDAVLDRVFARAAQQETEIEGARQRARGLMDELMQHPPARQRLLVDNSGRFRDRMLCENLLAASHELGFQDPAQSQHLARLAVDIAERGPCDGDPSLEAPPSSLVAGLRARAWAQLGNAMRIGADLAGASQAFAHADALMASEPPIGLLDQARIFDLKASLWRDRRDLPQAARLLDKVIAIYRRLGQTSLLGHSLSQKAMVLEEAGDNRSSMALLRRALDLLDPNEEPRRFLAARHNLVCALLTDGRPREAFALLFHTRPLYLKMGDRTNLLRLRWVEGQVAQALNRFDQAEAAYREVRQAFVELGDAYDAALVSLDLAALLAQQGRAKEMGSLAQEMLTFFDSRQIHREAMAAFLVFCDAARMDRAGIDLVQEVAAFLKRARNAPDLRFSTD
jgi:tetratricopeptide (TPR) repeat protein